MRITLQPAFVIHHRPYRETSLLVELLTENHGRITVVARGVKGSRSNTRAFFQPFYPLLVSWQGKGELMTLAGVEPRAVPIALKGHCLFSAFYLNELLMRVLPKYDPYPRLYAIYQESLQQLQQPLLHQKTLRLFEKKLLEELGYGLQLQYDSRTGVPFDVEQVYSFCPDQGFKPHQAHEKITDLFLFSGKSLLAMANEQLETQDILNDAKRLMRLALAPLLGPKPLQSRKLFIRG